MPKANLGNIESSAALLDLLERKGLQLVVTTPMPFNRLVCIQILDLNAQSDDIVFEGYIDIAKPGKLSIIESERPGEWVPVRI